tara:strand:- start:110 stop:331 length:222 start_codon:yes stop_codon:yes gene_type:complete
MSNTKNILINRIDVAYRDIENFEFQYVVMKSILNNFNENQLKVILNGTKKIKKIEIKENIFEENSKKYFNKKK